jgi:large subunit ribosomal protein L25
LTIDDGNKESVLIKDLLRHPVTRELLHVDLIRVDTSIPVEVEIPVRLTGRAPGVVMGGTQRLVHRTVTVRCLPANVPVEIVYDVKMVQLNEVVTASQLALPEGVELLIAGNQTVASVMDLRRGPKEGEEETAVKGKK